MYVRKNLYLCIVLLKKEKNMKELIQHFRGNRKKQLNRLQCVMILATCGLMLFSSAILQGCSLSAGTTVRGKATIITTDTTVVKHNGTLKFKKSMYNK